MDRLLIFGGTTEGREIAQRCARSGISVTVSVATAYGASLLPPGVRVLCGRMDAAQMTALLRTGGFTRVLDATHPYAVEATANIRKAAAAAGVPYERIVRERSPVTGLIVPDEAALIAELNVRTGCMLSTLGRKSLPLLTQVRDFRERIYARVLPAEDVLDEAVSLGYDPSHILMERPPFSVEDNLRHIRLSHAQLVITKESGKAGGFPEKQEACRQAGIPLVTLMRPEEA